jgi:hypothetical protein
MSLVKRYLNETVTLVSKTLDTWGALSETTTSDVQARVDWKTRLVRNFAGEQVVSAGTVILLEMPSHESLVRISGTDHTILAISEKQAFRASHYEVSIA